VSVGDKLADHVRAVAAPGAPTSDQHHGAGFRTWTTPRRLAKAVHSRPPVIGYPAGDIRLRGSNMGRMQRRQLLSRRLRWRVWRGGSEPHFDHDAPRRTHHGFDGTYSAKQPMTHVIVEGVEGHLQAVYTSNNNGTSSTVTHRAKRRSRFSRERAPSSMTPTTYYCSTS